MSTVMPELGSGGWVTDPKAMLTLGFSHVIESDYSQSTIYQGKISSIAYIVAAHQNDPYQLKSEMEQLFDTYYGRYFNTVSTNVQVINGDHPEGVYDLAIDIEVTQGTQTHKLSVAARLENSKLKNVIKELQ